MTNLINSQPRFGLEETPNTVRIFDYATGLYVPVGGALESVDGIWDTNELATLIKSGQSVFGAMLDPDSITRNEARARQLSAADRARADKVEQAKADFLADEEVIEGEQQTGGAAGEGGNQLVAGGSLPQGQPAAEGLQAQPQNEATATQDAQAPADDQPQQ